MKSPLRLLKHRVKSAIQNFMLASVRDIDAARLRRAAAESAEFVDLHMGMAKSYPSKVALLQAALQDVDTGINGLYCEFGVYRGQTINFISRIIAGEVHGFDSFEGLPESWRSGYEAGKFKLDTTPEVGANVRLHKGWFADTLPVFKASHAGPITFLHVDADLYSSAKTILDLLGDRIVAGTVIQFDEFFNYPGWRDGEYLAFSEFCLARNVEVRWIGYVNGDEQVALKIVKIDPSSVIERSGEATSIRSTR